METSKKPFDLVAPFEPQGDQPSAIQEMVDARRYTDLNEIKKRLTQYDFQLKSRWDRLPKADQAELLNQLEPKQRDELLRAIGKR